MILLQAVGGLGNQLFIWNLAHFLTKEYGCKIVILLPLKKSNRENELKELSQYCSHNIKVIEADAFFTCMQLVDRISNKSKLLVRFLRRNKFFYLSEHPQEPFHIGEHRPFIIRGYFQDVEMVKRSLNDYVHEIHELMIHKLTKIERQLKIPSQYNAAHIRRGDYVENKETIGLLALEYFNSVSNRTIEIVCSDDKELKNLETMSQLKSAIVIGPELATAWESFSILGMSKTLVMSNSTFSWWAGQLVLKSGGEVFAPRPWMLKPIYGKKYLEDDRFIYLDSIFN